MPFNEFGSTIGSDARSNVFHEIGPGIWQMVKGFTPKFVSGIGQHHPRPDPEGRRPHPGKVISLWSVRAGITPFRRWTTG